MKSNTSNQPEAVAGFPAAAQEMAKQARDHLFLHILPFWCCAAVDQEKGGWMGWLDNRLQADRSRPKGLIVHSRILWTFSAVWSIERNPLYRKMAERAFDFLVSRFWDQKFGGAFWQLADDGQVIDDSKKIYGQAFCVYALTEFYLAFGAQEALDRAKEIFALVERHAHDPERGGYFEVCQRDWSAAGPGARLSEKDLSEKKSMNNHLHVLEAWSNFYRATGSSLAAQRLHELIHLFLYRILDSRTKHLHHFFDEHWRVRSNTYTFGHDIEASWLLGEAAGLLRDAAVTTQVQSVATQMAEAVLTEGIHQGGGLCYEGCAGKVIDGRRECWPQAEAVIGFLNAFELTGDHRFVAAAVSVWQFIQENIVDRIHGEWFWRINDDGRPDDTLPKVSEWKGPYHGSRACLEISRRISIA